MSIIASTEPHFVRTIKPNNDKKPNFFDGPNSLRQLRYSGLLETIKIRAAGFAYRPTYKEFYDRFKGLAKGVDEKTKGLDPVKSCHVLLQTLKVDMTTVRFGETKLFMKAEEVRENIRCCIGECEVKDPSEFSIAFTSHSPTQHSINSWLSFTFVVWEDQAHDHDEMEGSCCENSENVQSIQSNQEV